MKFIAQFLLLATFITYLNAQRPCTSSDPAYIVDGNSQYWCDNGSNGVNFNNNEGSITCTCQDGSACNSCSNVPTPPPPPPPSVFRSKLFGNGMMRLIEEVKDNTSQ